MPYIVGILYDHWNYFQEGAQDDFLMDKCLIRINSNNTLTIQKSFLEQEYRSNQLQDESFIPFIIHQDDKIKLQGLFDDLHLTTIKK